MKDSTFEALVIDRPYGSSLAVGVRQLQISDLLTGEIRVRVDKGTRLGNFCATKPRSAIVL